VEKQPIDETLRAAHGARRWSRADLVAAAVVAALSAVACAVVARRCGVGLYWDTPSYLEGALKLTVGRFPSIRLRLPGYPTFLALAGGRELDLARVVVAQCGLWVASNLLVFAVIRLLGGSLVAALAGALAAATFVDLLFMSFAIYSEPLALFAVDAAAVATVLALRPGPRQPAWTWAAALLWLGATLVRPIFVVPTAIFFVSALVAASRTGAPARGTLRPAAAVAAVLLAICAGNKAWSGTFHLTLGNGLSLLNYVGHPQIYERLPESLAPVRSVYAALATPDRAPIGFWRAQDALLDALGVADRRIASVERAARDTALACVRAVPTGYLEVWRDALAEYFSQYELFFGWVPGLGDATPWWPEGTWPHRAARAAERLWRGGIAALALASFAAPALALALRAASARARAAIPGRDAWALATLSAVLLATALASTAIEPWQGQMRYRMPVEHLHLAVAVAGAVLAGRAAAAIAATPRSRRGATSRARDPGRPASSSARSASPP
jgi:hypothetical protein